MMALDIQKLRVFAGRTRLGRVWRWGRSANGIAAILRAPEASSNFAAVSRLFPDVGEQLAGECRLQLLKNNRFFGELNDRFVERRKRRVNCSAWNELIYVLVRLVKPHIMVETGVFDGVSSAIVLQALSDNQSGTLISVDLPARRPISGSTDRMVEATLPDQLPPGWAIPDYLRARFHLHEGDSRQILPDLLRQYPKIDIFFHDSLHTFEHQHYEYTTAWPHIVAGGLLMSDDIFFNSAFHAFCLEQGREYVHVDGFGVIRK